VPSITDLENVLNDLCDQMKDDVFEKYVEEYLVRKRPKGTRETIKYARQKIDAAWTSSEGRIAIVGGKDIISSLSAWSQAALGVGVSVSSLLRSLRPDDLDGEVLTVIKAIEKNGRLVSSWIAHAISGGLCRDDARADSDDAVFERFGEVPDATDVAVVERNRRRGPA
jgi:sugar-specific transcriptional regulator TrmB